MVDSEEYLNVPELKDFDKVLADEADSSFNGASYPVAELNDKMLKATVAREIASLCSRLKNDGVTWRCVPIERCEIGTLVTIPEQSIRIQKAISDLVCEGKLGVSRLFWNSIHPIDFDCGKLEVYASEILGPDYSFNELD